MFCRRLCRTNPQTKKGRTIKRQQRIFHLPGIIHRLPMGSRGRRDTRSLVAIKPRDPKKAKRNISHLKSHALAKARRSALNIHGAVRRSSCATTFETNLVHHVIKRYLGTDSISSKVSHKSLSSHHQQPNHHLGPTARNRSNQKQPDRHHQLVQHPLLLSLVERTR